MNTNETLTINYTRHNPVAFQELGTRWIDPLQNYLQRQGLGVQVRTLALTGVRGLNEKPSMNTLGVEIEGKDVRKNRVKILAYVKLYFDTYPKGRIRSKYNNTNIVGKSDERVTQPHPIDSTKNLYPIINVVVKL